MKEQALWEILVSLQNKEWGYRDEAEQCKLDDELIKFITKLVGNSSTQKECPSRHVFTNPKRKNLQPYEPDSYAIRVIASKDEMGRIAAFVLDKFGQDVVPVYKISDEAYMITSEKKK